MVTAKNRDREGNTGSPNPVQLLKHPKGKKMAKKATTTGKLSEILKEKVEIDFCCPECEGTKLYEMHCTGRRVRVFSDGEYSVDECDSIEPDWIHYCCGACGQVICKGSHYAVEGPVRDPFDLVGWLFEEYLDFVR